MVTQGRACLCVCVSVFRNTKKVIRDSDSLVVLLNPVRVMCQRSSIPERIHTGCELGRVQIDISKTHEEGSRASSEIMEKRLHRRAGSQRLSEISRFDVA